MMTYMGESLANHEVVTGGVEHAIEVAYSTPIRLRLQALPEEKQAQFKESFSHLLEGLSMDGKTMGRMVSNVLIAEKSN